MSTPEDQVPMPAPQQQSPLEQYMATYGQQLQSMLASDPNQGAAPPANDPAMSAAGSVSDLGPDLYRPQPVNIPQQSALASAGGAPGGAPAGPAAPRSALDPQGSSSGGQGSPDNDPSQGKGGLSFRDLWNQQSKDDREKYVQQLQDHLKQADQTIDSAYQQMMDKMGARPSKDLSKDQKGMLLMEFGMRMMEHSRSQYGQTNETGGAIGQAGTETLQSAKGMMANNQSQQQRYDQMQEQLTIAQGKEKAQLASRSALEQGRDDRAYGQQNAMLGRTLIQQQGATDRATTRANVQLTTNANNNHTKEELEGMKEKFAQQHVTRAIEQDDGTYVGVTATGQVMKLQSDGTPVKGAIGGGGKGGGKGGSAATANYGLYMQTYGTDKDGKPLQGDDLKNAQEEALKYAANPRTYALSDAQRQQMAQKSADSFIRSNQTSFIGMTPQEIQQQHDDFADKEFNRLKRGGPPTPISTPPRSALEGAGTGTASPPPAPAPGGAPAAPAAAPAPQAPPAAPAQAPPGAPPAAARGGQIPTAPPPGSAQAPNSKQLDALRANPQQIAPYFLQKFGYLPREYQQFAQQSALGGR